MSSFAEHLQRVREEIREESVEVVAARVVSEDVVLIDVRERDEYVDGHAQGCIFIPRGLLDQRIESLVVDKASPLIIYCAGGTRSALAAHTLGELGYTNVVSLIGGFSAWKSHGLPTRIASQLSDAQTSRYSRHLRLPEIGSEGQLTLLQSRVLMIGLGGLGSPVALYLAAAGIGTLGLVDDDVVDRSNLQRQVIHADDRVGHLKVDSAAQSIAALNPDVKVVKVPVRLGVDNVDEIFGMGWDMVVDGGDNFPTRYLVNDACLKHGIALAHGSVHRFEGQVTMFHAAGAPCYRCLFPEPPSAHLAPNCQEAGVVGVLPGVVGLLQANEVIKYLLGLGQSLSGRLLVFDALESTLREIRLSRDSECVVCGPEAKWKGYPDYQAFCSGT